MLISVRRKLEGKNHATVELVPIICGMPEMNVQGAEWVGSVEFMSEKPQGTVHGEAEL